MKKSCGNSFVILLSLSVTTTAQGFSPEETVMHNNVLLERSKRQLLWPNTTVLQFNIGLGTPTPVKTIQVNWAFQANFQLPWNRTQIPIDILQANSGYDGSSRSERDAESKRSESKMRRFLDESYSTDNGGKKHYRDVEENETEGRYTFLKNKGEADMEITGKEESPSRYESDTGLYKFYKYVADMLNGFGYNGTDCVLRALCQIGAEPLHSDDEEDLLHELASFVLNPNHDIDDFGLPQGHEAHPFIDAYNQGQGMADCGSSHQCPLSLVDMFTVVRG